MAAVVLSMLLAIIPMAMGELNDQKLDCGFRVLAYEQSTRFSFSFYIVIGVYLEFFKSK